MQNYLSVLDNIQAQMADFAASSGIKNPVTKAEWNQVSELIRCMESTEKMPAFLRTTDSVEREFSVPEEYLEKQEKFEQKKAEMLSKWNENFLSQDMSSYHVKYEEANKKVFFLKGKAQAALVADMQNLSAGRSDSGPIRGERFDAGGGGTGRVRFGRRGAVRRNCKERGAKAERAAQEGNSQESRLI